MITATAFGTPRQIHHEASGHYRITDYIRGPEPEAPQAFLVHDVRHPGVIAPHFHKVQQFQVIVSRGAILGRRPAPPLTVQYADPFTPYGPIVAGEEEPLAFFTLRAVKSDGIYFMPGSRDKMEQKAGRNLAAHVPDGELPEAGTYVSLLEDPADGMAAFSLHLRPGEALPALGRANAGARYYLVTGGSLLGHGGELSRFSLAFLEPGEQPDGLVAGNGGALVLAMRFPDTA